HCPGGPDAEALGPVLGRRDAGFSQPLPAFLAPQLAAPIAAGLDELEEVAVGHGCHIDPEGREIHLVARTFVVVRSRPVVGAELDRTTREEDHFAGLVEAGMGWKRATLGGHVGVPSLE